MFNACNKVQLSELAAHLLIELEITGARHSLTLNEVSHLRSLFIQSQEKRLQKGSRASSSIKKRFADNDAALMKIYKLASQEALKTGAGKPTFRQFTRMIDILKSKPTYIRKPKLSAEEKLLSKADLEYVMQEKAREDWATTTIRSFYEEQSGQKATTKK